MAHQYNDRLDAFELYHKTRESEKSLLGGPALPALGHAIAGSAGAAISNLALYPLDLVITRLQSQRQLRKDENNPRHTEYRDIQDAFTKIYNQEGGLPAFYSGILQDTAKTMADSFLFFLAYNFIRQSRLRSRSRSATALPILDELATGMAAGAFSKLFTTPIQNIVTRKQTAAMTSSPSYSSPSSTSTRSIFNQIYREKGLSGFWSGYSATLILTLNPSLTFFLHETLSRLLPGAHLTFLLAAISKAIASTITYPFSLAKTRAQVSAAQKPGHASTAYSDEEMKEELERMSGGRVNATRRSRRVIARTTVLSTILHIARTEGVGALYEGLAAEVLKGFFSHGITMLVKERVLNLIIAAYQFVLRGLEKSPSPEELRVQATEKMGDAVEEGRRMVGSVGERVRKGVEDGKGMVGDVYGRGKEKAGGMVESAREMVGGAGQKAGEVANKGKDMVGGAVESGKEMTGGAVEKGREMVGSAGQKAGEVAEKGKDMVSGAVESGKDMTGGAVEKGREMVGSAGQKAGEVAEKGKGMVGGAVESGKEMVNSTGQKASEVADKGWEMVESGKDMTSGAVESGKNVASSVKKGVERSKDKVGEAYNAAGDAVVGKGKEAVAERSDGMADVYDNGNAESASAGDVNVKGDGKKEIVIVWGPGAKGRA